ncbi:hypothetical protein ACIQLK_13385 [Microbacterium sp. NPDC091382]|uniref:hypothetical protein n=1 Tax=Microbacterium sp. NPDC091382 TaxID=3364210 RepID=UPI0037F4CC01
MALPPLENLAYPADDVEHPEGGHCASLGGSGPEEDRVAIIEQWARALRALVDSAEASEDRWSLSRPILFAVHQLCENALDVALDRHRAPKSGNGRHSLGARMDGALKGAVYDHLTDEERAWCSLFVAKIAPLTGGGFPGRYANAKLAGTSKELDELWCCINPVAIADAAILFVGFTLESLPELEETAHSVT